VFFDGKMGSWTIYVWTDIYTNFDMERCWRRECFGRIISGTYENLQLYGKDHQKEVHEKIWKMPFLIYALPEGDKIYYPIHDIFKQPVYAPNSSAKK